MRTYFISYAYDKGFGHIETELTNRITKYNFDKTIDLVKEAVTKKFPETKDIIILNFIELI